MDTILRAMYGAFNRRDAEAVLAFMSDDVEWPNAMEGTVLHGKDPIREYWRHQWSVVDPQVEPIEIRGVSENRSAVRVNQVVRTPDGTLISEGRLEHVFDVRDGLIVRMEVQDSTGGNRFRIASV